MRNLLWLAFTLGLVTLGLVHVASAQQDVSPAPRPETVTVADIEALGNLVSDLPTYRDNPYLRDQRAAELHRIGQSLVGARTDVLVLVRRVTRLEVLVEVHQVSRARIALLHGMPPEFGNLGTWTYEGPWKVQNFHRFASPVGIRIGLEIPLETARTLRHGDILRLQGQIVAVPIVTRRSAYNPSLSLIVGNWKVVEVIDADTASKY